MHRGKVSKETYCLLLTVFGVYLRKKRGLLGLCPRPLWRDFQHSRPHAYPWLGRRGAPLPHLPRGGGGTAVIGRCTLYSLPTPLVYVCVCVCACVCMCACVYVYATCVYVCMCVYHTMCVCTCVYGTHLSTDGTRENAKCPKSCH